MYGEMSVTDGTSLVPFCLSKAHCCFAPSICLKLFIHVVRGACGKRGPKLLTKRRAAITPPVETRSAKNITALPFREPPIAFSITMPCSHVQAVLEFPCANERPD